LAADDRYDKVIGDVAYQRIPLKSVSSEFFFNKLAKGDPIYNVATLTDYVKDDIQVIEAFEPDFIIGDFRLSLAISTRLKKVPYATITNAYWSPWLDLSYPIPEIPLTKILGVTLAQKLFNLVKPIVFMIHSLALNKTCKKFGLPPLAYDMRESYTHADYTLYADVESLLPMKSYPDNHYFIGPVLWSAQVALPDWWTELPTDKPVIFVTMGSSGDNALLPVILETLSTMEVIVLCVTANHNSQLKSCYKNIYMADFLPGDKAVKKADIVICNGGSPMVYQSLVYNKKVIGIPGNLDQYLMMSILQKAGKGEMIRSGKINANAVQGAVSRALLAIKDKSKQRASIDYNSIEVLEKIIDSSSSH